MDIYCPRCTEPWDSSCIAEAAEEHDSSYDLVRAAFKSNGCSAIEYGPDHGPTCEAVNDERSALVGAALELSDHPDDWAADLDGWI